MKKNQHNFDDLDLTKLLLAGSNKAFKIFYERHQNRIFRLAFRYLKCEEEAQEVVQEVFIKFWENRDKIEIGKPLEAWIYTIGKNHIFNKLKKKASQWKLTQSYNKTQISVDNSIQNKIQDNEYALFLNNTLKTLTEKQLVVYTMAREDNFTYYQIANQLNISVLTVKTHMSRALCHIRNVIETTKILS